MRNQSKQTYIRSISSYFSDTLWESTLQTECRRFKCSRPIWCRN